MKAKFIISIILWTMIIASNIRWKSDEKIYMNINNEVIKPYKLSRDEQLKRFEYLLSGQTNKYECESDYEEIGTGSVITDDSWYGKWKKVIYCKSGTDKPGYIVKGLIKRDNKMKTNNKWMNDTSHSWYIRLRMRIKQSLIYPIVTGLNEENWHTQICRLEVVNTEGKIIKIVEYEGKDFWEKYPGDECRIYYSGNYEDSHGRLNMFDSIITISGEELNPNGKLNTSGSKLDYRIYWYGYTDMWIDYIKMENDVEVDLLSGKYDMWLQAMDSITKQDIKEIRMTDENKLCINYLMKKVLHLGYISKN